MARGQPIVMGATSPSRMRMAPTCSPTASRLRVPGIPHRSPRPISLADLFGEQHAVAEPGQLVLNLRTWSADPDPAFVEVAVYADGRVIWVADERVGFVEQRLTAGGVERLRSRVLSAGLFDGNLALGIDGVGWGNAVISRWPITHTAMAPLPAART